MWHFVGCPTVQEVRTKLFPRLRGEFADPLFIVFVPFIAYNTSAGKAALLSAGLLMDALYVARATLVHNSRHGASSESLVRGRLRQHSLTGGLLRRRIVHITANVAD